MQTHHHDAPILNHHLGILIHGYDLKADAWEHVVFGEKDRLGRVPTAIEEAVNKKAAFIFWGSGGSQTAEGMKESEYIYSMAIGQKLKKLAKQVKTDPQELTRYLQQVSFIDTQSKNTREEIQNAVEECKSRGIKELTLISSPTHIQRCLKEACVLETQQEINITFYARASKTCFAHSTPGDVTIIEPPHRSDTPQVPFYKTLREILPFLKNSEAAFALNEAIVKLIEEHKQRL